MQRIRVGLTGLAFVLLLIGLTSAIFSSASRERPVVTAVTTRSVTGVRAVAGDNAQAVAPANKEPLAELGVAPSADLSATVNSSDAAPRQRR